MLRDMPNTSQPDLVGSAEACALLGGIDRSTLVRWVQAGRLVPAMRLPGQTGAYLFRLTDVRRLAREVAA